MSALRQSLLRMASELPKGDPTRRKLLAALKQAGPRVTRAQEGFVVEGGDWPRFLIEYITKGRFFSAERPPDKVSGTAHYQVKPRAPEAYCIWKADINMSWRSPTRLVENASSAVFEPMGRSSEELSALVGPRAKVSVQGGLFHVQFASPVRNPVDGLVALTLPPASMYQKIPLADMKRDGVLEDADIEIGGARVGTVLVPVGLAPVLDDLRGLFK